LKKYNSSEFQLADYEKEASETRFRAASPKSLPN